MGRRHQAIGTVAVLLGLWLGAWFWAAPAFACDIETPDGYRLDHYRAPTPCDLPGGQTVDALELQDIIEAEAPVLIDAMPVLRTGETDFTGRWTVTEPRENIPGSVWLPNIGYGVLDEEMTAYFKENLEQVTEGDRHRPVVFYCFVDCWMSWNAARRALEFGYVRVIWYPEGTDGWKAIDAELEPSTPVPLFEE